MSCFRRELNRLRLFKLMIAPQTTQTLSSILDQINNNNNNNNNNNSCNESNDKRINQKRQQQQQQQQKELQDETLKIMRKSDITEELAQNLIQQLQHQYLQFEQQQSHQQFQQQQSVRIIQSSPSPPSSSNQPTALQQHQHQQQVTPPQIITHFTDLKQSMGLSPKQLSLIKQMKIGRSGQRCTVCLNAFAKGDVIRQLPCKHIFHKKGCLDEWLTKCPLCPLCRAEVRPALLLINNKISNKACKNINSSNSVLQKKKKVNKKTGGVCELIGLNEQSGDCQSISTTTTTTSSSSSTTTMTMTTTSSSSSSKNDNTNNDDQIELLTASLILALQQQESRSISLSQQQQQKDDIEDEAEQQVSLKNKMYKHKNKKELKKQSLFSGISQYSMRHSAPLQYLNT